MPHITVLLHETIDTLNLKPGATVLDGTFGGGGHSHLIATIIGKSGTLVAFDRDQTVFDTPIAREIEQLCHFVPVVQNFRFLGKALAHASITQIDAAVFDLGLSSTQLDESGRGFSFLRDEPLQMTFSLSDKEMNAEVVVNEWSEATLAIILKGFGEESFARSIAAAIVIARTQKRITRTKELVDIVMSATPGWYHRKRIHPATRTFQALRMAVNGELDAVEEGLPDAIAHLRVGGRIGVISFHSIEDRSVKNTIKKEAANKTISIINKKPILPSDDEIKKNPRSRSAKLRVIERI